MAEPILQQLGKIQGTLEAVQERICDLQECSEKTSDNVEQLQLRQALVEQSMTRAASVRGTVFGALAGLASAIVAKFLDIVWS